MKIIFDIERNIVEKSKERAYFFSLRLNCSILSNFLAWKINQLLLYIQSFVPGLPSV